MRITSEILGKLAPSTPPSLRDRFLPFLNEAMPRYNIDTVNRVRCFLTTVIFESQWLQKTKEGKARANTKAGRAQAKYWPSGFFGRGLIQTTHQENYQQFANEMVLRGKIVHTSEIMDNPALLEQPKWAVESACFFWKRNNLNKWADAGDIADVESVVNTGKPHHKAWGEEDREILYKKACRVIPDDFTFDEAAPVIGQDDLSTEKPPVVEEAPTQEAPPLESREKTTILNKADELGNKVQSIDATAEKFQVQSLPAGLGTKLSVFWKQVVVPVVMMFWGWVSGHWQLCLIIAIAAVALGTFEWIENRKRNNPTGAVPPVADPNAKTWKL